jgi:hypothetical protein
MSMVKAVPASWDFGLPLTQHVKVASAGLHGEDRRSFVKRASAVFADKINTHLEKLARGEELIHVFAIGADSHYSSNRNGDSFDDETCEKYHPTFVKHAHLFRDHVNRDPRKSYGRVVDSAFHPTMKRIELLVALNGTKEAAERNRGLVADLELEKLASDKDICTSMACLVKHDVCSGCQNKAKNRSEYCGPEKCVKYGGCKTNLGHLYEDGHVLRVFNPEPKFFDISHIHNHGRGRGADRIAFVLGKVASCDDGTIGGAELAEQWGLTAPALLGIPSPLLSKMAITQLKIAQRLVEAEHRGVSPTDPSLGACPGHVCYAGTDKTPRHELAEKLAAAHQLKCLLPVGTFLGLFGGQKAAAAADAVAAALPGIHEVLASDEGYETRLHRNPYLPQDLPGDAAIKWAMELRPYCGIRYDDARLRLANNPVQHSAFRVKQASEEATKLAEEYALYQLAFLATHAGDTELPFLEAMTIRNNFA